MRYLAILFVLLSSLSACKPKVTSVRDPASFGASSGVPRYWTNLPLTVYVANEFDQDFPVLTGGQLNPFEEMMRAWDDQVNVNLFTLDSYRTDNLEHLNIRSYEDGELGIYRIENWFANITQDALAIAVYRADDTNVGTPSYFGRMIHADIMINFDNYEFYLDHTPNKFGKYDLKTVVLHELGHLVGIDHIGGNAVMNAFLSAGEQKRTPLLNDTNAIRSLYQPSAPAITLSGLSEQGPTDPHPDEGKIRYGVIELLKSGECRHYENDALIHSHQVDVKSLE